MSKKINIIVATVIVFSSVILFLFILQMNREHVLDTDDKQAQESKDSAKDDLEEINKNLPEGIKVEKRDGQQVVVNEKDGYEIKASSKWGEFTDIQYLGEQGGQFIIGSKNTKDWASISILEEDVCTNLETCLKIMFQNQPMRFYSPEIIGKEKIGNYEVTKVKDEDLRIGNYFFYYFQNNSKVYEIYTDYSEESIRDVILNGNFDYHNEERGYQFEKGDEISVIKRDKSNIVQNQTQDYSFEIPMEWFVEETIAPVPGVTVWNESRKCKIDTGFIVREAPSIDELVQSSLEYSAATISVEDFTLLGKYKGKKLLHRYGDDPIVTYIESYVDVDGKIFSLSSGGEWCDSAEEYFNHVTATIRFVKALPMKTSMKEHPELTIEGACEMSGGISIYPFCFKRSTVMIIVSTIIGLLSIIIVRLRRKKFEG